MLRPPPFMRSQIRYLCCDFDGTLTTSEGALSTHWYELQSWLQRFGVQLIIITGRPQSWGLFIIAHLNHSSILRAVLVENGRVLLCPQANLNSNLNLKGWKRSCLLSVNPQQVLSRWEQELLTQFPTLQSSLDNVGRMTDLAFELPIEETIKQDLIEWVRQRQGSWTASNIHFHIATDAWEKASGVKHFINNYLGLSEEQFQSQALFVGDALNDESCFKWFQHSLYVGDPKSLSDLQAVGAFPSEVSKFSGIEGLLSFLHS